MGFQALAFRILSDDFQSTHQKYPRPLSWKRGSPALFSSGTEPILEAVLLWFSMSPCHVQILAQKAGCGEVPWNGHVHVCVGIGEARVHFVFLEAWFQKLGEPGSNAQIHKKRKNSFSQSPSTMRNLAPWAWARCPLACDIFSNWRKYFLINSLSLLWWEKLGLDRGWYQI